MTSTYQSTPPSRSTTIVQAHRDQLRPNPKNARRHSPKQIRNLKKSIQAFGFAAPIIVDKNNTIICGHARFEAASQLGIEQIPTIRLEHLSPRQVDAYRIADNRLAEMACWDDALLAETLRELVSTDLDFDIEAIGFEVPEIEFRIESLTAPARLATEPAEPEISMPSSPVSCPGDLWILGRHRILCGNALHAESYKRVLGGSLADLAFTDPPYNVPIAGHASGLGQVKHTDFAMASGEMTSDQFVEFLSAAGCQIMDHIKPGAISFICMDWRHIGELLKAGVTFKGDLLNICVWVKSNAGMGSFYRSQHEFVFVYKKPGARHRNNIQLGRFGRNRTNVWNYPGAATPARGDEERGLLGVHPTVKPVTLVADALIDCSAPKDTVLDPFAGSGTTIIAAERTGRQARAIELDPRFVDVAVRRWEVFTRQEAVHADTGKPFGTGGAV